MKRKILFLVIFVAAAVAACATTGGYEIPPYGTYELVVNVVIGNDWIDQQFGRWPTYDEATNTITVSILDEEGLGRMALRALEAQRRDPSVKYRQGRPGSRRIWARIHLAPQPPSHAHGQLFIHAPGRGEVWATPGRSEEALRGLGHELWHLLLGDFHPRGPIGPRPPSFHR